MIFLSSLLRLSFLPLPVAFTGNNILRSYTSVPLSLSVLVSHPPFLKRQRRQRKPEKARENQRREREEKERKRAFVDPSLSSPCLISVSFCVSLTVNNLIMSLCLSHCRRRGLPFQKEEGMEKEREGHICRWFCISVSLSKFEFDFEKRG